MTNDTARADGELTAVGGRWQLRFSRSLPHPQEKVWRAITEAEHLAAWFPHRIVGERVAGAPLRFEAHGDPNEAFEGEMLRFDPPRIVEVRWGDDVIRIELEPDGAHTVLTLLDTFGELGKAARDAAGWHECLDRLVADLAGRDPSECDGTWKAVNPLYVEKFGPDASTVGPPEGHPALDA
jgi:uncharacterized protein YndB with AHSA1/START domain